MNITVSLTPEMNALLNAKVQCGLYNSVNDAVCKALYLLQRVDQDEAEEIDYLRKAWDEGQQSEMVEPFDMDFIKQEGRRQLAA